MSAKTPKHGTSKQVIIQPAWELVPVLNPRTGKYNYKYRKQQSA